MYVLVLQYWCWCWCWCLHHQYMHQHEHISPIITSSVGSLLHLVGSVCRVWLGFMGLSLVAGHLAITIYLLCSMLLLLGNGLEIPILQRLLLTDCFGFDQAMFGNIIDL